jgi:rsbT co-antagonist protein RsbR
VEQCGRADVSDAGLTRREEVLLRAVLDNLDIIVWTMEKDGLCTFHEGKALTNAGLPQRGLIGQNLRELYKNLDPEPLERACKGELQRALTEIYGKSWVNWMIPIRGEGESVEGIIGLSLDVTEQREGEKALREKLQQIEEQRQVIRQLSTPIIEVWDRVLTVPIIGTIDAARAAELMDNLLQAVTRSRAQFAILDLTGVEEVDTGTASHLLGLVRAVRLLGAEGVITGIHPNIAQTFVSLGLETSTLTVRASLREALRHCIAQMSRSRK